MRAKNYNNIKGNCSQASINNGSRDCASVCNDPLPLPHVEVTKRVQLQQHLIATDTFLKTDCEDVFLHTTVTSVVNKTSGLLLPMFNLLHDACLRCYIDESGYVTYGTVGCAYQRWPRQYLVLHYSYTSHSGQRMLVFY